MRVAIVTETFLPVVNGVSNSVVRVVEHLVRSAHQAMVIAPGAGPDSYHGVPVVRVPAVNLPVVDSVPVGLPTRKVVTALRDFDPDVVHLASPVIVGALGLWAARRLAVPTVAVYQTDVAGFADSYGLGFAARAAWRWIQRVHSGADRTLAPSSAAAAALAAHGVPRVHRWARGVDTAHFRPSRRDERLRAQLAPHGEILVGFVGRLAPEKRVLRLSALQDIPGIRLVVVGDGPDRAQLAKRLPTAAFLGFQTGIELARSYASLDVFVHTGPFETFCQTVQEALASGLPVIAPDAGGPRDLVAHGCTGFLLPETGKDADATFGDALRRAVLVLAQDSALRSRYGAAARRSVLRRTWPALCDELLTHYAEVTGLPADTRPTDNQGVA
ncbi:MAG: glycosyltransferase family 1 protein [Pseudonocardiales bacterium]|nr:glycosyltransferase family 1 protein [Pseudonocardiales bacterium]MBV9030795.1 glycosyltransferase family 1 protein [Pseudonocardiales bacterium]MBW0008973.1 glycosyltransferase family 1 protein [Pseudonocardiales bacterium]